MSSFQEEDSEFFFGREEVIFGYSQTESSLIQSIYNQSLIPIIGPSGCGKSSIIFAGVIPHLREKKTHLITSFRPGSRPVFRLALELVKHLERNLGETQQIREAAALSKDLLNRQVDIQQIFLQLQSQYPDKKLLIIVDQFEEIYTLCKELQEQKTIIELLLESIKYEYLTLIFILRADFYGHILENRLFRDALQKVQPLLISSMNRNELYRAVTEPAKKVGIVLPEDLVKRLLDDVGNEPGNLPLLEFSLTQMWDKRSDNSFSHQIYDAIGGVKKALVNHAEFIYLSLTDSQQYQVKNIFLQLVCPGEGIEDTRRVATRQEIENWDLVILLASQRSRLLITDKNEETGEDIVEIAHEALIREWSRLKKWLKENRDFRVWQEGLRFSVRQWKESSFDMSLLLRGTGLSVAQDWLASHKEQLQAEYFFIEASIKNRDNLLAQQKNKRKLSIGVLIAALIIVSGLASLAFLQRQSAISSQQEAENNEVNAQVESQSLTARSIFSSGLEIEALLSMLEASEKLQKLRINKSQDLRTEAQLIFSFNQVLSLINQSNRIYAHNGEVTMIDISNDGKFIASSAIEPRAAAKLWNSDGTLIATLLETFSGKSIEISPDSKSIGVGGSTGDVTIYDSEGNFVQMLTASRKTEKVEISDGNSLTISGGLVYDIAFSPDSQKVAISNNGFLELWNIHGELLHNYQGSNGITSLSFSPDGKNIISSGYDSSVKLWDDQGNLQKIIQAPSEQSSEWGAVAHSPDGKLISSSANGKVKLWNVVTGYQQVMEDSCNAWNLSFSYDSQLLAGTCYDDGFIKIWDANGDFITALKGHRASLRGLSFHSSQPLLISSDFSGEIVSWNLEKFLKPPQDMSSNIVKNHGFSQLIRIDNHDPFQREKPSITKYVFFGEEKISVFIRDRRNLEIHREGQDGKIRKNTVENAVRKSPSLSFTFGEISHQYGFLLSPNHGFVATLSYPSTVDIYDINEGKLDTFQGHFSNIKNVSFSANGRLIAISGEDNIKIWEIEGDLITTISGRNGKFSLDGSEFVFSNLENELVTWELDLDLLNQRACIWLDDYLVNYYRELKELTVCHTASNLLKAGWNAADKASIDDARFFFDQASLQDPNIQLDIDAEIRERSIPTLYDEARKLAYRGEIEESVSKLNIALEINSEESFEPYFVATYMYATALIEEGKQLWEFDEEASRAKFEKAAEIQKENPHIYTLLGITLDNLGDYDSAIEKFNRVIELEPEDKLSYYNRGVTYQKKELFWEALNDYELAIGLDEHFANSYIKRSEIFWMHYGDYEVALKEINQAILVAPKHPIAYHIRARIYLDLDEEQKAISDFKEAAQLFLLMQNDEGYELMLESLNKLGESL